MRGALSNQRFIDASKLELKHLSKSHFRSSLDKRGVLGSVFSYLLEEEWKVIEASEYLLKNKASWKKDECIENDLEKSIDVERGY
jgi:hypothetical protein